MFALSSDAHTVRSQLDMKMEDQAMAIIAKRNHDWKPERHLYGFPPGRYYRYTIYDRYLGSYVYVGDAWGVNRQEAIKMWRGERQGKTD